MRRSLVAAAFVGSACLAGSIRSAEAAPPPVPSAAPHVEKAAPAAPAAAAPAPAPVPTGTAPSEPSAETVPPAATTPPPPPAGGPPPSYYVEPQPQSSSVAADEGTYEPPPPPPPVYEPPPPRERTSLAPETALWVGVRAGLSVPFGSLWVDGFQAGSSISYRRRTFGSYASAGPMAELDVGARLSRRYLLFAIYEHASYGTGGLDDHSFGGQERGATNFYGGGLRFSTDPGSVGFALEIGLGYRDFRAYWADGTRLTMTDGVLDARIGLGADIRLSPHFSLSPMLVLGGGSFGSAKWSGPSESGAVITGNDEHGQYGTFSLQLGAHADIF